MSSETLLRQEIIGYLQRIDQRGWVSNHDGNLSVRIARDRYLATPTGMAKVDITASDLLVVDLSGTVVRGKHRIFSEWILHRTVYEQRPEVTSVVHAHPPFSTAFGATSRQLPHPFLPEAVVSLGPVIPRIALTSPGQSAADALKLGLPFGQCCLIEGNGALSWGTNGEQAFLRMELLEHIASIAAKALSLGEIKTLPSDILDPLIQKHVSAGLAAPHVVESATAGSVEQLAEKVGKMLIGTSLMISSGDLASIVSDVTQSTIAELKAEK